MALAFTVVTWFITLENQMKLVKNCVEYATMKSEAELELESDPIEFKNGEVIFKDAWMKYKGAARSALCGINFKIKEGEKVGIKGRTGSGKSSIINTLFRLYELDEGAIFVGDQDISEVGLHCLRRNISYKLIDKLKNKLFLQLIRKYYQYFNLTESTLFSLKQQDYVGINWFIIFRTHIITS